MNLLLDTHAVVWWLAHPHRLSDNVRRAVSDSTNTVLASAVAGYEIELKRSRDPILAAVPWDLEGAMIAGRFVWLPIRVEHSVQAGRLPLHHRDPWDRILVAQAQIENAILVTVDPLMAPYGVGTLW